MSNIKSDVHPFERSGAGIAPFRLVGYTHNVGPKKLGGGLEVGSPGQPMGSCDHCGTGIAHEYHIADANGKNFIVGSSCVEQVYSEANAKADDLLFAVRAEKRKVARDARHKKEAAELARMIEFYKENETCLKGMMYNEHGTAFDSVEWYAANAGTRGKLRLFKELEKIIVSMSGQEYSKACADALKFEQENAAAKARQDAETLAAKAEFDANVVDNSWLIDAMETHGSDSNFLREMVTALKKPTTHSINENFSERQVQCLRDFYSKATGGRRGSQAYLEGNVRFDSRAYTGKIS